MIAKYESEMKTLDKFYKNFFSYQVNDFASRFLCAFFTFILLIMMCIPDQAEPLNENLFPLCLLAIWVSHSYLAPYTQFVEEKKGCNIYGKIKYLPISPQAFRLFLIKKFSWFSLRLTMILLAVQLFFAYLAYHQISWHNVAYPLLSGFVFPMVIACLEVFATSSK